MSAQTSLYPELAREIAPAQGKLGVLLPGLGAVATTLIAGVHLVSKGLAQPYGSLTQLQKLRLGKRTHPRFVCIKDLVPLADLADLIWCGSTEAYLEPGPVHETLAAFERGLKANAPEIAPSMIYAYAALLSGIPFANSAPNLTVDIPALMELAQKRRLPIAGKDLKTGQTWLKTILAPGLKARMLGLQGWFSTNILGNRDGEVLDDPGSFRTKEVSKSDVLEAILQPELYADLYGRYYHKVRIEYYPPRGDAKEGWDNIDIFGWLGQPMQIKINFLCRDSILAAPLVLDLILLLDLAKRAGLSGIQDWLSFYFKSPMSPADLAPEHDLFIQHFRLTNMLRRLAGEAEVLDHSDFDDAAAD